MKNKTLIFTATYNEKGNIERYLKKVFQYSPDVDVLIVDDNSPDGTGMLLDKLAKESNQINIINRPGKLGLGSAHHLAMLYAIKNNYDNLVTMDADLSHDPKDIPKLLNKLKNADFVIGARYIKGGGSDYTGYRKFLSKTAGFLARTLLLINLNEFTSSFRAFNVNKLKQVNFLKMHNQGYSFFMESIVRFHQAGLKLTQVPSYFYDREHGISKIPKFEIFFGILKLFHLFISRVFRKVVKTNNIFIDDKCGYCHSEFLSVRYLEKRDKAQNILDNSDTFKCSSMTHSYKPLVAKCLNCGLHQIPLKQQATQIDEMYENVIDEDYLNHINVKKATFKNAYKQLNYYLPKEGRLLEIGSYCGVFLSQIDKNNWQTMGIEPSRWAAEYSKKNYELNIINSSFEQSLDKAQKENDVIVSWDVLEHVVYPNRFLNYANDLLNKNGILAFSTLDIDSWFPKFLGQNWPWMMDMHLYYFDKNSLEFMLEEAGFELLDIKPYRHYASIKYAYRKVCYALPKVISKPLLILDFLAPNIMIPVTLGDIKMFIARKK